MSSWGDRQRIESEIRALFVDAGTASDELQSSLARYACILANGYLEASCREILSSFSRARAERRVTRYVEKHLGLFSDPNVDKLLRLVGDFDPDRRTQLDEQLDDRLKDGINSIHAHRNNIAHGRQSSISMSQIKPYFDCAAEVVGKIRDLFPSGK